MSEITPPKHPPTARYLRVTGGRVYDPLRSLDGSVQDVLIEAGRIIDHLPPNTPPELVRVIDATGCVVMPGGIDIHTHIAWPQLTTAAPPQPSQPQPTAPTYVAPIHAPLPTAAQAALRYARLGYTTLIEAAAPTHLAHRIRDVLSHVPLVDTGFLLELGNHPPLIDLLHHRRNRAALDMVAELIRSTAAYGLKLVNPGGVLHFHRTPDHRDSDSVDQPIAGTRVTPRQIISLMVTAAHELGLPHPPHLHCHHLGLAGNIEATIQSLDAFSPHPVHLAHAQFHSYSRSPSGHPTSAAGRLCEYLAHHPNVTADAGQIVFGPTWLLTADDALTHRLNPTVTPAQPKGHQPIPYTYSPDNPVHGLQWSIGLELMLRCENPWQMVLSVDHPSGGPFWSYPQIIAWLMNKSLRDEQLAATRPRTARQAPLRHIDRQLTLGQIAIMTRAAPARALGLVRKGHLTPGADADLVVYEDNTADPQRMFSAPRCVIKAGHIVPPTDDPSAATPPGRLLSPASADTARHPPTDEHGW